MDKSLAVSTATGAAISIAPGLVVKGAGFGAKGVIKYSLASAWQSKIGLVTAKSFFAFLQSAGATSLFASAGVVIAGTVVIGGVTYVALKKM